MGALQCPKPCSEQLMGNAVCQQAPPWQQLSPNQAHAENPHCGQNRDPNTPLTPLCVIYGMGGWWVRAPMLAHAVCVCVCACACATTNTCTDTRPASTPTTYCIQVQCMGSPPNPVETHPFPPRCHAPCLLQAGHQTCTRTHAMYPRTTSGSCLARSVGLLTEAG